MAETFTNAIALLNQNAQTKKRVLINRLFSQVNNLQTTIKRLNDEAATFEQLTNTCEALATLTQDASKKAALIKAAGQIKDYKKATADVTAQVDKQTAILNDIKKAVEAVEI